MSYIASIILKSKSILLYPIYTKYDATFSSNKKSLSKICLRNFVYGMRCAHEILISGYMSLYAEDIYMTYQIHILQLKIEH
ncbi:hypothetical protein ERO13_A01G188150v2 [Gossypium hirsutum]|uniref:Uncharacterized protein n=2 Tax=Gossypium TaxID=3633 RepID=A0A5J5X2F5_GOSBA|nr:hypothetical protein ES319_A01G200000v1 [Gossypium barbadense]KAG4215624.1 hypothetical protein ERO13_A01G188150v2 [Gossypium hirsutum]TYJ50400.1 hypothetical protein E1A91_A01G203600v1 [Gossypium mustelinum]